MIALVPFLALNDGHTQTRALQPSSFAIDNVAQQGFRQAFTALAVQAFMGEPNDLVVHTASALEIDKLSRTLAPDQQFRTTVDHGSYFQDAEVATFIAKQLDIQ